MTPFLKPLLAIPALLALSLVAVAATPAPPYPTLPGELAPASGSVAAGAADAVPPRHARISRPKRMAAVPAPEPKGASRAPAPDHVADRTVGHAVDPACKAKVVTIYAPLEDIEKEQNDEMMAILAKDDADALKKP